VGFQVTYDNCSSELIVCKNGFKLESVVVDGQSWGKFLSHIYNSQFIDDFACCLYFGYTIHGIALGIVKR
jgi:hypothetical protein